MTARTSRLLVGAAGAVALIALGAALWLNHDDGQRTAPTSANQVAIIVVVVVALTVNLVVGAVVALAQRDNPVGWLFLALGLALVLEGPADEYAQHGPGPTGDLPGAGVLVVLFGSSWIVWFTLVALILLLTPTGRTLSPRWRLVARAQAAAGVTAYLMAIPSDKSLDPPHEGVRNPMRVEALQPWADLVGTVCVYAIGVGLIASGVSLVLRFRRARGDDRLQLLWLVFAVAPLPIYVVLAFVSSRNGSDLVTTVASGGFITVIPIAAGLSVLRYRLYDVERIVSTTLTWSVLSAVLVSTYGLVVWLGARAVPNGEVNPEVAATVGALAAVAVAAPARRGLQEALDRRFDRRAHDARRQVTAGLAAQDAGIDMEALLRAALRDDALSVAYPSPGDTWVTASGEAMLQPLAHVDVARHGRLVARIGHDPALNDATRVAATASLACVELDNGRLRAELSRQLTEIDASRRRLTNAQRRERRRIERDLHDGAQQRLLALAFELQSAQLNGDPERMRQALCDGADSARLAVRELRELANGLHPAALSDGGLTAALDDLARHSPVPLRLAVTPERLDPALEFTAWLVVGEAVVNAQKHAGATAIEVDVSRENGHLLLRVADDGRGGANPDGPGLRGLRDRVETAHGHVTVRSATVGTTIEAVLPCGS